MPNSNNSDLTAEEAMELILEADRVPLDSRKYNGGWRFDFSTADGFHFFNVDKVPIKRAYVDRRHREVRITRDSNR